MSSLCRLAVLMLAVVACTPDDAPTGPSTSRSPRSGYNVGAAAVATPAVDAGTRTTCAIRAEGSIVCWGSDAGWSLTTPPAGAFSQFDLGSVDACGVTSAGAITCWGASGWGQRETLPALPAGLTYRQVAVGVTSVCAVRSDGSLICWADTRYGVGSPPAGTFTQVGVGHKNACAISTTGTLSCWGTDEYGTITAVPSAPVGRRFTQVAVGVYHSCALLDDGSVQCWGRNHVNQTSVPALPADVRYSQVTVSNNGKQDPTGLAHSCALRTDGNVVCWGDDFVKQIDVAPLPAGVTYTGVSAGSAHTCATRSDGTVACWGLNVDAQSSPPPTFNLFDQTLKTEQTITFTPPTTALFGTRLTLSASGGASNNPVVFTSLTPGICNLVSATVLNVSGVGECIIAADQAGNDSYEAAPRVTRTIGLRYPFTGFSGLSAPPTVNKARPGSTIELAFSLGGNVGTGIIATGSPTAAAYTCGATPPAAGSGSPVTGGPLTYNAKKLGLYRYAWPTQKSWANSCYQLSIKLVDGSVHTALFDFK